MGLADLGDDPGKSSRMHPAQRSRTWEIFSDIAPHERYIAIDVGRIDFRHILLNAHFWQTKHGGKCIATGMRRAFQ
jgi:hypothetical protein